MNFVEKITFTPIGQDAYFAVRNPQGASAPFVLKFDLSLADRWKDLGRLDAKPSYYCRCIAVNQTGSRLLLGSNHPGNSVPKIVVWTTSDSKIECVIEGGFAGEFMPSGDQIVAAKDNDVLIYHLGEKPLVLQTLKGHTANIRCVAVSPDGKIIAAGSDAPASAVRTWDAVTGKELQFFLTHGGGDVTSVRFSADGSQLMSAGTDGVLRISDTQTGAELYKTPTLAPIMRALLSPGGRRAYVGMSDGSIKSWQLPR